MQRNNQDNDILKRLTGCFNFFNNCMSLGDTLDETVDDGITITPTSVEITNPVAEAGSNIDTDEIQEFQFCLGMSNEYKNC